MGDHVGLHRLRPRSGEDVSDELLMEHITRRTPSSSIETATAQYQSSTATRLRRVCAEQNAQTVQELARFGVANFKKIQGVGVKTVWLAKEILAEHGLAFKP